MCPPLPATLALLIIKAPCCLWPWEAFHLVSQRLWWTMITYWFCPLWRLEIDTYICVTIGCVVLFKKSLLPALEELLHVCTCVCENQDNLEESIFSFHLYVGPGDGTRGTRAVGLGSSRLGRPMALCLTFVTLHECLLPRSCCSLNCFSGPALFRFNSWASVNSTGIYISRLFSVVHLPFYN